MSAVLRGRQEIPDKFTPSFIADNLDEDDPNYEAQKAEAWEVNYDMTYRACTKQSSEAHVSPSMWSVQRQACTSYNCSIFACEATWSRCTCSW